MERQEIIEKFGVDPVSVGNRHRGFWIVDKIEYEEECGNAEIGDLCVKTRDGGSNPIDPDAFKAGNCVGTSEDGLDCTYRYYYYRAKKMSELTNDELTDLWIGAFRYFCGRSTIAASFFADTIIKHKDTMPMSAKIVILRDLERDILDQSLRGADCDKEKWEWVFRELKRDGKFDG